MPKKSQLNEYEKGRIDTLVEFIDSKRKIASIIGRLPFVVLNYLNNKENYGKNRTGGPKQLLSLRDKRHIINYASNKVISLVQIKDDLNLNVSIPTIWRVLNENPNIKHMKIKSKPVLKPHHKLARLEFAKHHMSWTKEWQNVIFSDEKKFNLDGPDGFHSYWHDLRKEVKVFSKRNFGGGSLMVWAGFGFNGMTNIAFTSHKMKSSDYINLLGMHLLPFGRRIGGKNWVLQQDNAPIDTSNASKEWFARNNITLIDWPSISPDLNPIENLWGTLVRAVYANGKQYESVEQLKQGINDSCEEISPQVLQNLVNSMPSRIFMTIANNGGPTKY